MTVTFVNASQLTFMHILGEKMDTSKGVKKYNPISMRDENGTYPVWMNQRKIRKQKKFEKRKVKAQAKKKKQK